MLALDLMTEHFETLLSDADAGSLLGLHPKTVQRMARRGEISAFRLGKYWRYRATQLNDWLLLNSNRQTHPPAHSRKESIQ